MDNKKYFLFYPLSLLYRLITDIRNKLYDTGILSSRKISLPLICVGNITVGGTGKTPHTEYISDLLRTNYKVAVLSRGYRRKTKGFLEVKGSQMSTESGDEPLQIALAFPDILVAVDGNRVRGAEKIIESHPDTEVIILDDAFQHRSIRAGLSILLTDFNRLISRDHLLPYGRLREKWTNAGRADILIVTKTPADLTVTEMEEIRKELKIKPSQSLFFTSTTYQDPLPVFADCHEILRLNEADKYRMGAVLVTGIASHVPFKLYLQKYIGNIIHLQFPDHHYFSRKDIAMIEEALGSLTSPRKLILTTSKDAVRLTEFTNIASPMKEVFFYIPVGISFVGEGKMRFDKIILDYVGKNHKNRPVPQV